MLSHMDILACPACKGRLWLQRSVSNAKELLEGELFCDCGRRYAVLRGVPRLLEDQSPPSPPAQEMVAGEDAGAATAAPERGEIKGSAPGKSCLVCGCHLGSTQVELCRNCSAGLLRQGLNEKVLAGLYEALELRAESNTYTDYTLSDQFAEWLAMNRPKDANILEIGCGGGYLAEAIRRKGFDNLLASDFNGRVVETAVARFPGLQGMVMDSARMAFAAGTLDCVVSVEMVEHLLDPERHFDEVARVLKPGGVYLVRTPNALAASIYYRWAGRYDMAIWHPSTFSSSKLHKSLERRGLAVRHLTPGSLPKSQQEKLPRLLKFLAAFPLHLVPIGLRPSICLVATKRP